MATHKFEQVAGGADDQIVGEFVTWSCGTPRGPRYRTTIQAIRAALAKVGLNEDTARDLCKRHAFTRVLHEFEQDGIVEFVSEDAQSIQFQFNGRKLEDGRLEYPFRAILSLLKHADMAQVPVVQNLSGTPEGEELKTKATAALLKALDDRSANDVTRLVHRIVQGRVRRSKRGGAVHKAACTLFQFGKNGCFFAFKDEVKFLDKVEAFCEAIGANFDRAPIASSERGNKSITRAVVEHIRNEVADLEKDIDKLTSTRESSIDERSQKIEEVRFLLEARKMFLADEAEKLGADLKRLDAKLVAKAKALMAAAGGVPVEGAEGEGEGEASLPWDAPAPDFTVPPDAPAPVVGDSSVTADDAPVTGDTFGSDDGEAAAWSDTVGASAQPVATLPVPAAAPAPARQGPAVPKFRKNAKSGKFEVFGPASLVKVGQVTVHKSNGTTEDVNIVSVSRSFDVDGVRCAVGTLPEREKGPPCHRCQKETLPSKFSDGFYCPDADCRRAGGRRS